MEESIFCPKCHHKNSLKSLTCESCGFALKTGDTKSDNWLDSLRKTGELRELDSTMDKEDSPDLNSKSGSDTLPDWLKRIQELDVPDKVEDFDEGKLKTNDYKDKNKSKKPIANQEHKGKNDQDYEWLQSFRDFSDPVEKPEEENSSINSSDSMDGNKELAEDQPLLSIEDIKENWQNEFPLLSDNVLGEDISPADDLPEWLNKDFAVDQPEPEQIPTAEETLSIENQQTEATNDIPEWLKSNEKSSRMNLEENNEIDNSIPEWLKEIKSSKNKLPIDEDLDQAKNDVENDEYLDSELLFNKLNLDINDTATTSESQSSMDYEHGIEDDLIQSDLPSPAFILEKDDLPSENPFLFDDDDTQFFQDTPQPDEDKSDIENQRIENNLSTSSSDSGLDSVPFSFDGIPDWLEKVRLDELDIDNEKYSTEAEVDKPQLSSPIEPNDTNAISQANLPEWLKAIRPIEVVTPDVSRIKPSKRVEQAGPLAGLTGVLSTENISNLYASSKTADLNIEITEKQKMHAALLEEIISPINLQSITSQNKTDEKQFLSIVVPVLFLILIVFSIFFNKNIFSFPVEIPAETVRFHNLITGYLNQNQTPEDILLISEMDASAYPEMNLISKSVIENLFANNHRISSLATNPNGIIVSTAILENATQSIATYNFAENVINLGYLPANHLGIQSFLADPRGTILTDYEGNAIWTSSYLSNVDSITDFDLIILMTDNAEKSRVWIEQIKIFAPDIGFVVISTTQAIPLLQPYVDSHQIDGMIGGIPGNLAFTNLLDSKSNELERFAFLNQISVLLIIIFLLIGSLTAIFTNMKKLMKNEKKQ